MTTSFGRSVTASGGDGDDGHSLSAAPGRFHLYVSLACPFAHRTLVLRKLKGLEKVISVDVVNWNKGKEGWHFEPSDDGSSEDSVNGCKFLSEVYFTEDPKYAGKISVPVLYDKQEKRIVSNESGDIIKFFNSAFNSFCETKAQSELDLYPEERRKNIDDTIKWINDDINIGVYKCGFAQNQEGYNNGYHNLFNALDRVEDILAKNRYLMGGSLTLADIRLYTTLVRFDPVYFGLFKCNKKQIRDFPNLQNYLKELYQVEAFKSTTNFYHIKNSYYFSMDHLNPNRIVPLGPEIDLNSRHDRNRFES